MRKQVSFIFLSTSGSAFKQFTFPRVILILFSTFACMGLTVLGFLLYDYLHLKRQTDNMQALQQQVADQQSQIIDYRKQVKNFADEINNLKTSLVALNSFENKIRVIANLEQASEKEGFFGLGGTIPEDLNAKIPLTDAHNQLMREMHDQVQQLGQASEKQAGNFKTLLEKLNDQVNLLAATPAILPSTKGWVTSNFGQRTSPFTGRKEFHKGLDIAYRNNSPIIAPADGRVTWYGKKGLFGNMMIVNHGHGIITKYAHLKKAECKVGKKVKRGEVIARMGNSGRSTGPHLHYEVHINGIPVDPRNYILN